MSTPDRGDYLHQPGRYRWFGNRGPIATDLYACEDCGAAVAVGDQRVHDRFHAILNAHGKSIAVLLNAHLTQATHDRFDVRERIASFDNWSADALAEVTDAVEVEEANAVRPAPAGGSQ